MAGIWKVPYAILQKAASHHTGWGLGQPFTRQPHHSITLWMWRKQGHLQKTLSTATGLRFGTGPPWSQLLISSGHLRSTSKKTFPEAFWRQRYQGQGVGNDVYMLPPTILAIVSSELLYNYDFWDAMYISQFPEGWGLLSNCTHAWLIFLCLVSLTPLLLSCDVICFINHLFSSMPQLQVCIWGNTTWDKGLSCKSWGKSRYLPIHNKVNELLSY